jgi:uncharacterized protein DUF4440
MSEEPVEAERLRAIERERLHALVTADVETADRLHADDFQLITPGGGTVSKAEYLGGIASGEIRYLVFEAASPIDVRLSERMAALRYQSRLEIVYGGVHIDLQHYWHTDLYERDDTDGWRVVWSQATKAAAETA